MKRAAGIVLLLAAVASPAILHACIHFYPIWGIPTASPDAFFGFVRSGKVGYIDAEGKIKIPPTLPLNGLDFFGEFHEGLLGVNDGDAHRYVDRSGKTVFETKSWTSDFSEGLAPVQIGDRWGFIDRAGKVAISAEYRGAYGFSEGFALVVTQDGKYGYIDHVGKQRILRYFSFATSFHDDRAGVITGPCTARAATSCGGWAFDADGPRGDCRWSIIDWTGRPVSKLLFDEVGDFSENLAPIMLRDLWGYANREGQIAIAPRFEKAESFSEGLARVRAKGKWGFIDHMGKFVIPAQFKDAESFHDGRAMVVEHYESQFAQFRFIDKSGGSAFAETFADAGSFRHGLAPVSMGEGSYAWIDTSGKHVMTYRYKRRR